jgi:hypothetical protein
VSVRVTFDPGAILLPAENRKWFSGELGMNGLEQLSDADFTGSVIDVLRNDLASTDGTRLFDAIDAIRFRRDKTVGHSEIVDEDEMPQLTCGDTTKLLDHAKKVVVVIGMGYLSIMFFSQEHVALGIQHKHGDRSSVQSNPVNGEKKYTLTNDAYRTRDSVTASLQGAGLIERV